MAVTRHPGPYVIPADCVIGRHTPTGYTVPALVDEYRTCEAATEHNHRTGGGVSDAQVDVDQLAVSIVVTLRRAGHEALADALGAEAAARHRLRAALVDPYGDGLDQALADVRRHRQAVAFQVAEVERSACRCVPFEHGPGPDDWRVGRCAVHPS